MNILAIDTSSKACVLGIKTSSGLYVDETIVDRTHSKEILPRIIALLEKAGINKGELDLIVYGQGPGSFTGLRIGVGVVQGLAYGLDKPVVPVSSLACLAQKMYREHGAIASMVALTARNEEVYFGSYVIEVGIASLQGREGVFEASEIPTQATVDGEWYGVGSGWQLQGQLVNAAGVSVDHVYPLEYPAAEDLIDLGIHGYNQGRAIDAMSALPEYLREQVATVPKSVKPPESAS